MGIQEINARIATKLDELEEDQAERRQAQRVLDRIEARTEEVVAELRKVQRILRRRRAALEDVRSDLETLNLATPERETAGERLLRQRLDQLSGLIEEALTLRDELIAKLDRLAERRADAKAALQAEIGEIAEDREALERMRKRRRRIREAAERNDKPSPNFSWAEFDCNDGTPIPEKSKPAIRHWCLTVGEPVRARYGPVHVNSGFRHKLYNARIGGEPNSVHIYDFPGRLPPEDDGAVAVDFRCERGSPRDWYEFTAGKADGRGLYATFHHADNRNRIGWPDSIWTG
jgi:Peptidase M15